MFSAAVIRFSDKINLRKEVLSLCGGSWFGESVMVGESWQRELRTTDQAAFAVKGQRTRNDAV